MRKFLTCSRSDTRRLLQTIKLCKQSVNDFKLLMLCVELAKRLDDILLDAKNIRLDVSWMKSHRAG